MLRACLIFFFIVMSSLACLAQQKIELINANTLEGSEKTGNRVKRFIGNVVFKHHEAFLYCDSALFYDEKNAIEAFGNVHIKQGDTLNIVGQTLLYDGNTRTAQLFKDVKMTDNKMTLTTQRLDYELNTDLARYTTGGKIIDKENELTSIIGYYYAKKKEFFFREKVVLTNPQYVMNSDTLKYNTASKIVYFQGPTTIKGKDDFIYCENGWYNTIKNISQFNKNAYLQSKQNTLKGDSLYYNRKIGLGKAFRNISVVDTIQKIVIRGQYGESNRKKNYSFVTGNALFAQATETDSLFLHGDTLKVINDSIPLQRTLLAFHRVKIFKSDLQAKCDSLVYSYKDSLISMYKEPLVWSKENQMSSRFVTITIKGKGVDKFNLYDNAFVISKEDSSKFNQIKGKKMEGLFRNNELCKIFVEGNGQTVYYAKEEDSTYTGVNKAESSNILIFLKESKVKDISLITSPDATFYPIGELPPEELRLKGFKWQIEKQPKKKEDIFIWN